MKSKDSRNRLGSNCGTIFQWYSRIADIVEVLGCCSFLAVSSSRFPQVFLVDIVGLWVNAFFFKYWRLYGAQSILFRGMNLLCWITLAKFGKQSCDFADPSSRVADDNWSVFQAILSGNSSRGLEKRSFFFWDVRNGYQHLQHEIRLPAAPENLVLFFVYRSRSDTDTGTFELTVGDGAQKNDVTKEVALVMDFDRFFSFYRWSGRDRLR